MRATLISSGILVLGLGLMSSTMPANETPTNVDTQASVIEWKAAKVTGKHNGTIGIESGSLQYDKEGMLTGGNFVIDMQSITVLDLQGRMKAKLEGHLNSPDFFHTEEFPRATFKVTEAISRGTQGEYKLVGDLTIKGITKEIRFNANIDRQGSASVANADITVDRSEFDVRYGSGSFFDNLGDKTIYDDFDLTVKLVVQ